MKKIVLAAALAALVALPAAAATYTLDVAHSEIGFGVRHFGLSKVKGNFNQFEGTIMMDAENPANSSVEVVIQVASIDTDNEDRDNHLRSPDFFAAEEHPTLTFKSTSIEKTDAGYVMTGDLTMRGQTHQVSFPFELYGPMDTGRGVRLGAEGGLTVDRQQWGLSWSRVLDNGGLVVGNDVEIDLSIEAVEQQMEEEEAAE